MALTAQRYTFDEWLNSPLNTALAELVEGIPVERTATSSDHGWIVKALWRWLDRAEQAGYGIAHVAPVAMVLDAQGLRRNVREPDLCFLRAERAHLDTGRAVEGVPNLVIEVLSLSTRDDDLPGGEKWRDYERFGVPAYWVVDPEVRTITRYERRLNHFFEVARLREGDVGTSPVCPGVPLSVTEVFRDQRGRAR